MDAGRHSTNASRARGSLGVSCEQLRPRPSRKVMTDGVEAGRGGKGGKANEHSRADRTNVGDRRSAGGRGNGRAQQGSRPRSAMSGRKNRRSACALRRETIILICLVERIDKLLLKIIGSHVTGEIAAEKLYSPEHLVLVGNTTGTSQRHRNVCSPSYLQTRQWRSLVEAYQVSSVHND